MRHSRKIENIEVPAMAAALIEKLRAQRPSIHCVTNTVAQNFTANVLLAMGCVPSMTLSPEEIGGFVEGSDSLLINLGTSDRERRESISTAVETATRIELPWVLDPVFVDRSERRREFAHWLIAKRPAVMRLNHAEFAALAGAEVSRENALAYAREHHIVLGVSGTTDIVTDGVRVASIANGHPLMSKVTAIGCASSALVAACLAVEIDIWLATVSALFVAGIAGERAARQAGGPGSFAVAFIDALYEIDSAEFVEQARIT